MLDLYYQILNNFLVQHKLVSFYSFLAFLNFYSCKLYLFIFSLISSCFFNYDFYKLKVKRTKREKIKILKDYSFLTINRLKKVIILRRLLHNNYLGMSTLLRRFLNNRLKMSTF